MILQGAACFCLCAASENENCVIRRFLEGMSVFLRQGVSKCCLEVLSTERLPKDPKKHPRSLSSPCSFFGSNIGTSATSPRPGQLPPTVQSPEAERRGLTLSLYGRLVKAGDPKERDGSKNTGTLLVCLVFF